MTNTCDKLQHVTLDVATVDEATFTEGMMFDGGKGVGIRDTVLGRGPDGSGSLRGALDSMAIVVPDGGRRLDETRSMRLSN